MFSFEESFEKQTKKIKDLGQKQDIKGNTDMNSCENELLLSKEK